MERVSRRASGQWPGIALSTWRDSFDHGSARDLAPAPGPVCSSCHSPPWLILPPHQPPVMSFFGSASTSAPVGAAAPPAEKDIEVADPPGDSISSISFSPQADYLAVGSWDNNVCCVPGALYLCLSFGCRFASMKLARTARRREKPCTATKVPCLACAGTRYVRVETLCVML